MEKGWIGPTRTVENFLAVVGADRDNDGRFVVVGEAPSSFMGQGDELVIPAGCCYLAQGKPVPLAATMVSIMGEGAGRGLSVVVI